jgi:alanyl aminopeptidase
MITPLVLVAAALAPPTLRLPPDVTPLRYEVDLTVDPTAAPFRGRVAIDVRVARATPTLWLNAVGLEIDGADFDGRPATVVGSAPGFVALAADAPLEAGTARVHVSYHGTASDAAATGIFRVKDSGDWYLFSKFESIFARKALPCFDEPGFKVPFQLTLHVPGPMTALSNTPVATENEEAEGMKAVRFAETKPLPTYLFAFAVGPFDVLDAGRHGRGKTHIQLLVPRGRSRAAGFAAAAVRALFERLESYFDVSYPYEKLDNLAAPTYPGAMEDAGLVLYGDWYLLIDPRATSVIQRRYSALTIAHETAHQWFGDLVTTAWWDDIWLNEAFASWVEKKIVDAWQPGWHTDAAAAETRAHALAADATVAARQIRQPITSEDDIFNAFDAITYDKGASVIAMFEAWLGADVFARGVHEFLEKHAFGSATSADFLAALGIAAGKDVARPFSTFLDQPGAPEVTLALRCAAGAPPAVDLEQRRWLPLGSPEAAPAIWSFPVCVKHPGGRACTMLDGPRATLPLPDAKGCPAWLLGNDGELGYYLARYDGDQAARLAKALPALSVRERVGLLGDLTALATGGRMPAADLLALLPAFAADKEPHVVLAAVRAAHAIDAQLVGPAERPAWARYIARAFGPRARALGWSGKPGEDEATRLLRGPLLELAAIDGGDAKLAAAGAALGQRWLGDRTGPQPDVRGAALAVLVHRGDALLLTRLRDELGRSRDPDVRFLLLLSLGRFADPNVLRQALALTVTDAIDPRETAWVYSGTRVADPSVAPEVWAFVRQNLDDLVARYPPNGAAELIQMHARMCDRDRARELEDFFKDRVAKVPGGPRALRQTLERIEQCVAAREAQRASLAKALR